MQKCCVSGWRDFQIRKPTKSMGPCLPVEKVFSAEAEKQSEKSTLLLSQVASWDSTPPSPTGLRVFYWKALPSLSSFWWCKSQSLFSCYGLFPPAELNPRTGTSVGKRTKKKILGYVLGIKAVAVEQKHPIMWLCPWNQGASCGLRETSCFS